MRLPFVACCSGFFGEDAATTSFAVPDYAEAADGEEGDYSADGDADFGS
jgi:hypothetical protein